MSRKMLINATRPQSVRGAIVDENGSLDAYELDVAEAGLSRGNIYVGTVANVEPSLNAAFIEYGSPKQGFLPAGEVCPEAYHQQPRSSRGVRIKEVLRRRRRILVQVVKDAIGGKGAALTTEIALAGRFVVLTPRSDSDGISRKIEAEEERRRLKKVIAQLKLPKGYGVIVRTSAEGKSADEIARDVESLTELWQRIEKRASDRHTKAGTCLYQDNDLIIRMLRDQFSSDIKQVWVDTREAYEAAVDYFKRTMPKLTRVVRLWDKRQALFSHFQLDSKVQAIYERRVELPSGGSLIIEPTEALTVVDVNSGRLTSESSQAETAYKTNLEAAEEIARQLRLRDIGGLIVVDFIDMSAAKHRRDIEKRLKQALKADRARAYVGTISENGLLEINRQRIKQALRLQTHQTCPACRGHGFVRGAEFASLSILRRIEERAIRGNLREVQVDLHPILAESLQNRYRRDLIRLEDLYHLSVVISGRPELSLSEERLVWVERPPDELDSGGPDTTEAQAPKTPASKDRAEPSEQKAEASGEDKEGNGATPSRSKKRRRRRRRSRASQESGSAAKKGAKPDAAESREDTVPDAAAGGRKGTQTQAPTATKDAKPAPRRKGRSRRAKKSAAKDAAASSDTASPPAKKTPPDKGAKGSRKTRAAESDQPAETSTKPAPKPRRSRSRRRTTTGTKATKPAAEVSPDRQSKVSKKRTREEPEPASTKPAPEKPPTQTESGSRRGGRRSRSTRRKESTHLGEGPAGGADETTAAATPTPQQASAGPTEPKR